MEKIELGKFVALTYDLYDVTPDGEVLLHQVTAEQPETLVYGVTPNVIEPLMAAISGLAAGADFTATVAPAEGFGEYSDEMVRIEALPREIFEQEGKLNEEITPGAQIFLQTSMGQDVPATILAVEPASVSVRIDFNHPLAGRTVCLRGRVLDVRQASAEELARSQACGCGGCGGDCGSGCGDSAGCDGCCSN